MAVNGSGFEKIELELKEIIAETFKINTENVNSETKLFDGGLALNSIQMIELTISIEKFYQQEFGADLLIEDNFRSISVLATLIQKTFFNGKK